MNILNLSLSQWVYPHWSNKNRIQWAAKCEILIEIVISAFFLCLSLGRSYSPPVSLSLSSSVIQFDIFQQNFCYFLLPAHLNVDDIQITIESQCDKRIRWWQKMSLFFLKFKLCLLAHLLVSLFFGCSLSFSFPFLFDYSFIDKIVTHRISIKSNIQLTHGIPNESTENCKICQLKYWLNSQF